MMRRSRLLFRLSQGALRNVRFSDLTDLVQSFELARISGSHHIFKHAHIPEPINIQEVAGQAKPYQIRRFLRLVERHNLRMEGRE